MIKTTSSPIQISTIGILLNAIEALSLFSKNVCKQLPGKKDEKIENVSCRVKSGFVKTQKNHRILRHPLQFSAKILQK